MKLFVNVLFVKVLVQMSSHAKFMKQILSNEKKLEEFETEALNEKYNAVLRGNFPLSWKILVILLSFV